MIVHGDIKLTNNGLLVRDGDLVLGEAPEQLLDALLASSTGSFRQYPTLGANLLVEIDAPGGNRGTLATVSNTLFSDGWRLDNLEIAEENNRSDVTLVQAVKLTDNTNSRL